MRRDESKGFKIFPRVLGYPKTPKTPYLGEEGELQVVKIDVLHFLSKLSSSYEPSPYVCKPDDLRSPHSRFWVEKQTQNCPRLTLTGSVNEQAAKGRLHIAVEVDPPRSASVARQLLLSSFTIGPKTRNSNSSQPLTPKFLTTTRALLTSLVDQQGMFTCCPTEKR